MTGNTPSKQHPEYYGGTFPFFKPSDLSQEINLENSSETLTPLGVKKSRFLPKGSVLVSSIGNIGNIGLLAVDGAFNQQINGIRPYSFVDSTYLFWVLQSTPVKIQMLEKTSATTISILNKSKFNTVQIIFPNILTQNKIVGIIGKTNLLLNQLK